MMIDDPLPSQRPVAIVPVGADAEVKALLLSHELRRAGIAADLGYSGNLKKRMQRANKVSARTAVIIGDTELSRGVAVVRNLDTGEQQDVPLANIISYLGS